MKQPASRIIPLFVLAAVACRAAEPAPFYQTVTVARRDIQVTANAAGTVLPLDSTEVKSKASGEVIAVLVQTGDVVRKGQLLVRIDPRNLRNAVVQAQAEVDAARAQLETAEAQLQRAADLHESRVISDQEHESAKLSVATTKGTLARATVALENAQIAFEDAEVEAPSAGIVLAKYVEEGSVISSATSVVGGTILLKLADVNAMQVRALVDETDIGKIAAGQLVRITADAFPDETFTGRVVKIEPQAVTQQNVVMFPVLARIENPGLRLRSGMSCEIEIAIGERRDVVAVPTAALRSRTDLASAAGVLGLTMDEVAQQLASDTTRTPYVVFVLRAGQPRVLPIRTGLTSAGYAEVLAGPAANDTVLVLPSASLLAGQASQQERAERMGGSALPGVQRQQQGTSSRSAPGPAP